MTQRETEISTDENTCMVDHTHQCRRCECWIGCTDDISNLDRGLDGYCQNCS